MSKENVNVDILAGDQGQGAVAQKLMQEGQLNIGLKRPFYAVNKKGELGVYATVYTGGDIKNPKSYRTIQVNSPATLRRDEWKQLDDALIPIRESRLPGVQAIIDRGLTFNLTDAFGTTLLEWHDVSDALEADLTIDGTTRGKNDRPEFTTNYLPIPIIHADFEINARVLATSRKLGNPLDTTMVERAGRKVAEKREAMLFTNTSYSFGGHKISSLINYASRNTQPLDTAWDELEDTSTVSVGEQILKDILDAKQTLLDNHFYGPYGLFIPSNYETVLEEDYNGYKNDSIRERLMKINNLDMIQVTDKLPADNVVLVQLTSDVIRIVQGMEMQTVQWSSEGNTIYNFKVMAISVPQIRSDQSGKTGIVHMSV